MSNIAHGAKLKLHRLQPILSWGYTVNQLGLHAAPILQKLLALLSIFSNGFGTPCCMKSVYVVLIHRVTLA